MSESNFPSWVDNVTDVSVHKVFELFKGKDKTLSQGAIRHVSGVFLSKFIGLLVLRALEEELPGNASDAEAYENAMTNLAEAKAIVQGAVSVGFTEAMSTFAGQQVDYYCQVATIPEPENRSLN